MSASICVVGIGQPHGGDDGVGWAVIDRLHAEVPAGIDLVCTTDAALLVERMQTAALLIVVDALVATPPGGVLVLDAHELAAARPTSSHALGVGEAIALGRALAGNAQVAIVAITCARPCPGQRLSAEVAAAVFPAARRVLAIVEAWRTG